MQLTFLVGNGFDLAQGLKTSFNDFCKWYTLQENYINTEAVSTFKHTIGEDYKYWSDFETALGEYTQNFSKDSVNEYLDCVDDASEELNRYLLDIMEKYELPKIDEGIRKRGAQRLLNFYNGLNPAETKVFSDLITPESLKVKFVSFNYTNVLDCLIKQFYGGTLGQWSYSGTQRAMTVDPNVLHVHGKNGLYPILGVDNEKQIKNQELFAADSYLSSTIIKKNAIKAVGYDWDEQLSGYIDSSTIVCIYGMSLGSTDKRWWEKILNWLSKSENRKVIIYYHCDNPPKSIVVREQLRMIDQVKALLKQYDSKDLWTNVENRVFVIFNSDIFNFSKI